jgi:hypothetical protein
MDGEASAVMGSVATSDYMGQVGNVCYEADVENYA